MSKIRLAMQKSGRLTEKTLSLLKQCGLEFQWSKKNLLGQSDDFPIELLMVRNEDIPNLLSSRVCDIGILGENTLLEEANDTLKANIVRRLGYSQCRLSLALPKDMIWSGPQTLEGKRIATSFPNLVSKYLSENNVEAVVVEVSGSVELTPSLEIADLVCDLVSTGSTLKANGLVEVEKILSSQAVLVTACSLDDNPKADLILSLLDRIDSVLKAKNKKYIMMNAPKSALDSIRDILPGMEKPSIMTLDGEDDQIAIHAVCAEDIFWETIGQLKNQGASSILVVPIEKIL